ncbi:MAG TPA: N-acetylmuramoyl-L-alanine amidase [Candidatus Binatia bacterium]|nr:N-acetylmuramoyl-L-alanine amidase [Candidatus Binatia bacterium]
MKHGFHSIAAITLFILGLPAYALPQEPRQTGVVPGATGGERVQYGSETSGSREAARLTSVRAVPSENGTRVLIEVSRPVRYQVGRLPEDNGRGVAPRIYVDIAEARLAMESLEPIHVQAGGVKQIRVGQFTDDTVRVVLDMSADRDHTAFLLPEPFRVVLDIAGSAAAKSPLPPAQAQAPPSNVRTAKGGKTQASSGIRKIVLDPGHGGKDPGAIGIGGLAEKDLVLSVAKKLAVKLRKEMGVQVVLTRSDDRFVALEDRTAIANAEDADLFISLHMNASHNGEARGIETYYLDNTTDEASIRLAARENSTSRKKISDLQFILSDMTQNLKLEDSVSLAHRLQSSMVGTLAGHMREVKDLGVKKALFYVLVGARMPSVLVEMFFITHREEGRAMNENKLQDAMADALFDGIEQYNRSVLAAKTL